MSPLRLSPRKINRSPQKASEHHKGRLGVPESVPPRNLPSDRPEPYASPKPHTSPWWVEEDEDGTRRVRTALHPGQRAALFSTARHTLMLAGAQGGKALALDTPIPTPFGWRTMGDLEVGDLVLDERGQSTPITYVSPIYLGNTCYRLTFDDGTSVVADAEHLWVTQTSMQRKNAARRRGPNPSRPWIGGNRQDLESQRTTAELAATLTDRRGTANHSLPLSWGPKLAERDDLPVPPYTLGAWLGDGHTKSAMLTTADAEVLEAIRTEGVGVGEAKLANAGAARGYRLGGAPGRGGDPATRAHTLQARLRSAGLIGNKHIPEAYLFAGERQRLALMQGLMDTDGTVQPRGLGAQCEYTTVEPRLASDVATLARSLGIKVRVHTKIPTLRGRPARLAYRLTFTTALPVFRLARKAARLRTKVRPDTRRRFLVACDPVPSVAVRCITVEAASGQYLCTTAYITTHNTAFGPLWLEREIRRCGPGDYMAVTATFPLLQRKMLPEFLRYFRDTLALGIWSRRDKTFTFHDGETRVMFGSATNAESLESATARAAWLDECGQSQFRHESWEAIQRRLSIFQGRSLMTSTPYNRGWLKSEVYDQAVAGDPDYRVIQFDSTLNPLFPKAEFDRVMRSNMPLWKKRMFYQGMFDQPPGLIYSTFRDVYRSEGGHLVRADSIVIPEWWPRAVGLDFGGSNTAKIYLAYDQLQDTWYVYHEQLGGGKTAAQHVIEIKQTLGSSPVYGVWGGSRSERAWRAEFSAAGLVVQEPDVWDVEVGIDRGTGLFSSNRVMVLDTVKGFRDELGTYSRPVMPDGTVLPGIVDKHKFHRLDAFRAVALGIGGPPEPIPVLTLGRARGWQPARIAV